MALNGSLGITLDLCNGSNVPPFFNPFINFLTSSLIGLTSLSASNKLLMATEVTPNTDLGLGDSFATCHMNSATTCEGAFSGL